MLVRTFVAFAVGLALLLGAGAATAKPKPKIDVAAVEIASSATQGKEGDKRLARSIRRLAHQAAKGLDFGKGGPAVLTLTVRELKVVEEDGVLRVTCTIVGTLKGGGSAKSRLSFGGKPNQKKKLMQQVVGSVTEGVVTRLSMLSREKRKAAEAAPES